MIIVAAMDSNLLIGKQGGLPWHIPADLQHFKALTMGAVIVMGSNTWRSFPKPLVGRHHIVITRDPTSIEDETVTVAGSIEEAIALAEAEAKVRGSEVFVIGGADIYRQTVDKADRMILTRIWGSYVGDTFFPDINPDVWSAEVYNNMDNVESNGYSFSVFDYKKI